MKNTEYNEIEESGTDSTEDSNIKVDWKNPPSLTSLKNDYTNAVSSHEAQMGLIKTWRDHLNGEGAAAPQNIPDGRSKLVPKLIRKQAEWRYSSLSEPFLSTDELFEISPVTYEDKPGAEQNALLINNQFNTKIDKIRFINDYVRAGVDEGTVAVRIGWAYEEEEVEVEVPIFAFHATQDPQILAYHQQLHALMNTSEYENVPDEWKEAHQVMMETGQAVYPVHTGFETITETKILRNHPTLEVCNIENLVIDPTCQGDPDKINFVIYSFESSKAELEKDGKYFDLDKIETSTASPSTDTEHESRDTSNFNFKDETRKKFVVQEYWGYWDINGDGTTKPIVVAWVGNTIIRMEEMPFPDNKIPFEIISYLPVRGSIYGEPDGSLLIDNQKILGAVTRGMIDIMGRSANGQIGYLKNALDITNKRKFDRGEDYEINPNVNPQQAFFMHKFNEIPQSAQFMMQMISADSESLTGVKAFHNGISGQALGDTATGVRGALDAASKRELDILRRLAHGLKRIGRRIIAMNAEFLSEEEVVRITNEQFVRIRRDDLPGNYDLNITVNTAESDNQKAQELAFMLQTMGNNMDSGLSKMILRDIARLRKMPALAKEIENYQPQPDPMAVREAELRIALLEAQVINERAKGMENQADIGLKTAKTATEQAKARNLDSKSDMQDLDFLETESGTKHERQLDVLNEQRKGQLDLKAAENLLQPPNTPVNNSN